MSYESFNRKHKMSKDHIQVLAIGTSIFMNLAILLGMMGTVFRIPDRLDSLEQTAVAIHRVERLEEFIETHKTLLADRHDESGKIQLLMARLSTQIENQGTSIAEIRKELRDIKARVQ